MTKHPQTPRPDCESIQSPKLLPRSNLGPQAPISNAPNLRPQTLSPSHFLFLFSLPFPFFFNSVPKAQSHSTSSTHLTLPRLGRPPRLGDLTSESKSLEHLRSRLTLLAPPH